MLEKQVEKRYLGRGEVSNRDSRAQRTGILVCRIYWRSAVEIRVEKETQLERGRKQAEMWSQLESAPSDPTGSSGMGGAEVPVPL